MSAAAVLRSACRALRGPSLREHLFLHRSPAMPREILTSRRLYSSDCIVNKPPPGDGKKKRTIPPEVLERMSSKLDRAIASSDRLKIAVKEFEEIMREDYERRLEARGRRVLFGGVAIVAGIVMYVKKQNSKKINEATSDQEMKAS